MRAKWIMSNSLQTFVGAIQRQKAEAERYILEQRAAYDEEQRQRVANWNAEKAQAEAVFAEEKRRNAAEAEAQAQAVQQERLRLEELDRQQWEQVNADARAKDARIQELSNELRNSQLKHEKLADDTLKNISNL